MYTIDNEIEKDLDKVEEILSTLLSGSAYEANVNAMCQHVVKAGGKRIRPRLSILSWHALNSHNHTVSDNYERMLKFASATELLHTATLVHDDVIDKATIRRGVSTLNDTEGNHAAVLAGDYLFTRCFFCLHDVEEPKLFSLVNETLAALVMGEINQLHNQGDLNISIADYEQTIYCKTGALFELTTSGIAILEKAPDNIIEALKEYGKQLGIAFQVADDMLDYSSSTQTLGKSIGEDLEDGRITLPLILALKHTSDKKGLEKAIKDCNLEKVLTFIKETDSLSLCRDFAFEAVEKAKKALDVIEDSPYKDMLVELAKKAANRKK
ncbi:MAG: polyprenyl synthetase family protein [Succinivibrio sp.]|jgi:octaprenyl-diphosphate synthase|nr:polyprenyl synthetase family protein [Succinivibrio sp.]